METKMESGIAYNEEDIIVEENVTEAKKSPKDEVMEDGKISFLEILYVARYFLPILTTIGLAIGLGFKPDDGTFLMIFSVALMIIGLLSAITVCPIKLITFPFKFALKGFQFCRSLIPVYGVADLCAAILGTSAGFTIGFFIAVGAPAVFTIKKFFTGDF